MIFRRRVAILAPGRPSGTSVRSRAGMNAPANVEYLPGGDVLVSAGPATVALDPDAAGTPGRWTTEKVRSSEHDHV